MRLVLSLTCRIAAMTWKRVWDRRLHFSVALLYLELAHMSREPREALVHILVALVYLLL